MMTVTSLWYGTARHIEELMRARSGSAERRPGASATTRGGHVEATGSSIREAGATPDVTAPSSEQAAPAGSRPAAVQAPRPALQGLLAFAAYLAVLVLVYARPLIGHLNTPNLGQYWTDPNFYTWAMQWWPWAVSHGVNPLFSSQIGAPHGFNLAWASTTPSVGLLMWPVTAAFGVLVSYNVMLLLVPPVSALACFIVARRLTGRFWASLLAGAVYGLSPYELVHSWQGQPNLTVIALFPLMVYLVLRWRDRTLRAAWFVVWMALAMAVEFYTFNESFFEMTLVLAGGLVIGFAVAGRAAWRTVARLAGLTAIAYAAAIVAAAPYLYYALKHEPTTFARQDLEFSLHLVRLVLPWPDKLLGVNALADYSSRVGRAGVDDYVGLPLLAVLLGLAVFAWRSKVTRLLVAGFALVIALAAGPNLVFSNTNDVALPWGGLWSLPIARSAEPSRFIVFGLLALAIALALWLAPPAQGDPAQGDPAPGEPAPGEPAQGKPTRGRLLRGARWALGLLAVAAILIDAPTARQAVNPIADGYQPPAAAKPANQLPPFITAGLYRRYLHPGEIVVVVTHRGNAGMLFQAAADFYFRIAGGFINASLTDQNAIPHPIAVAAHPSNVADRIFEDYLRSSGVGAILVEQAWQEPWMRNLTTRYGMHGTSAGGVTVYPVAPWLANRARLAEQRAQQAQRSHEVHQS